MTKINTIRVVIFMLILIILLCSNTVSCVKQQLPEKPFSSKEITLTPSEDVSVTIATDVYVMPVAELETTKTYPDIIKIENKYVKVSAIPNRGRLIFDYEFKPTGNSEFLSNTKPSTIKTTSDYMVEFGGYYLSIPWNPRDRQPYDLEYKLTKEGPDVVEVYMWGEDFISLAFVEFWLTVERDSSFVKLETKISNKTEKDINIKLKDYSIIAPGGSMTDSSSIVIPTSEVIVEQSKDNWMGSKGDVISWPSALSTWSGFDNFGLFYVSADKMMAPFFSVINHDTKDTLIKIWEPYDFFEGIFVWSFGNTYEEIKGAEPTVNFESYKGNVSIPVGETVNFTTYFYAVRDLKNVMMANTEFAGWLMPDKQVYEIANNQPIEIQLQVGSSRDYENINLEVFLADLNENVLEKVITEQVAALSPEILFDMSWKIKPKDIINTPGEYIFKLELLDTNGSLIFTLASPSILIK